MQFQSGYLLQSVRNSLFKQAKEKDAGDKTRPAWVRLQGLLRLLSTFEVETNIKLAKEGRKQSLYATATNILTRGLPTIPSILIEDCFADALRQTRRTEERGSIEFKLEKPINDFFQTLHFIDPRLKDRNKYINFENVESNFEKSFLLNLIPENHSYLVQLFEKQRTRSSFSRDHNEGRVDFSIEIPYDLVATKTNRYNQAVNIKHHKSYIVEVDGARYHTDLLDDLKDFELGQFAPNVGHIKEASVHKDAAELMAKLTNESFIQLTYNNYSRNEYLTDKDTILALAPFGIARLQRVLLEYLMSNDHHSRIKLAIVERDFPCGHLAMEDLVDFLHTLNDLSATPITIPEFSYEIFSSEEFADHALHRNSKVARISELNVTDFDLIIDVSVLRRAGVVKADSVKGPNVMRIRSSHYVYYKTFTGVVSAPAIEYRDLVSQLQNEIFQPEERVCESLRKLLQNIFRKSDFREGQLPILNRALKQKSVIGLLPTGGGKSLTYQLAAMLQPGVTVVIDPIRSLMKDQFDGLREIGIDKCEFINSTLTPAERRYNQNVLLVNGRLQFIFVSPERFVIEEFRNALETATANGHYFSYAVIDEVHCVSEWGHDFRTPYLNLGQNAQEFCLTFSGKPVPLFGLTATASFDVLADIERELSIQNDDGDAVIRFENSVRDEINYIIKEVPINVEGLGQLTESKIREHVGSAKQDVLFELIKHKERLFNVFNEHKMLEKIITQSFDEYLPITTRQQKINISGSEDAAKQVFVSAMLSKLKNKTPFEINLENTHTKYGYGMIVFTPHRRGWLGIRNGDNSHGVFDKPGVVLSTATETGIVHNFNNERLGYFMGSGDDDNAERIDEESFYHLDEFKDSRCSLMVATKAFGMGIDKRDVRMTVHMNIPQSIESFVQEAGRGGRDGTVCTSVILYNNNRFDLRQQRGEDFHFDKDVLLYFHKNSFKGQIKERVTLYELRYNITYPNATNIQLVADELNDLHGTDQIQFKIAQGKGDYANLVFVNSLDGVKIGYINILTKGTNIYHELGNDSLCYEVVELLKQKLSLGDIKTSLEMSAWLHRPVVKTTSEIGIERMLNDMQEGQTNEIVVPFTNRYYSKKTKNQTDFVLNRAYQDKVASTEAMIELFKLNILDEAKLNSSLKKAISSGYDYHEFIESLNLPDEKLSAELQSLTIDRSEKLHRTYYLPRSQEDTAKGIYRLISIGIIDSYTIDYHNKLYRVSFTKKENSYYFDSLQRLVQRYTSKNIASREVALLRKNFEIQAQQGKATVISKCLEYLTDFIYSKIKEKRLQAINDMVSLCETAIDLHGDPIEQNIFVKDEIYYYFNAKYTRRGFVEKTSQGDVDASLPDDLDNDLGISETIQKYLDLVENAETGEFISNLKHLRGSTMRMLRSHPDQPAYFILKAFSLFVMADSIKSLSKDAKSEFVNGLIKWKDLENEFHFQDFLNFFKAKLAEHIPINEAIFVDIEDEFYTRYYLQWTTKFRKQINLKD
jgi:ATP-dependent DNA helicase RecQ